MDRLDDVLARLTTALGDRYALERELGAGGMATVYLARDLKHDRPVALKVMRPEVSALGGADRFLREIRIAAQLNHPHILPLFDSGEADGLLFYVMPYVEGESLRDRLQREKQLPLEDALRITGEVAGALAYAHARGVVHRDIKPENILLEAGHALVADFGIARAVGAMGGETLTGTGLAVGTPAYMSPEQAAGEKDLDARSDVYSLGCVLFEMLGGEAPYLGTSPMAILAKKVSGPVPSVAVLRETVSPQVEKVVAKALARAPADRWSGAQALAEALAAASGRGEATGVAAGRRAPWRAPRRRVVARAGVAVVVIGVLAAVATWALRARRAAGLEPQRVVVAPFENATGDTAFSRLGRLAADEITQGLVQANIPGLASSVASLDSTQGGGQGSGDARLLRLAKAAGARIVVSGRYYRDGDSLRFQARISDAAKGEIIAALAPVSGPAQRPLGAVGELRQRVMGALALYVSPDVAHWGAEVSKPPLYEAYLAYKAGLAAYESKGVVENWVAARDHFHRAFALDSTFALALLWEASAEWSLTLGGPRFDSIIGRLEGMRERLSRYGQLRLDWLEAVNTRDNERSYVIAQRLVESPGATDADVRELATAALVTNRPREGLRVLERIDPHTTRGEPFGSGYWTVLATGQHMLGDYRAELQTYRHAPPAVGDDWGARYIGLRALGSLGRYAELQQALDNTVAQTRNPGLAGWYYVTAGTELMYHVRRDSGLAVLQRGIALLRTWDLKGADSLEADRRGVLAVLEYVTGNWAGCGAAWGTIKQPRMVMEQPCPPWILAARRGDRAEANRLLAAADSNLRGAKPAARTWATLAHARVAAILGDREDAMAYLRQAMPSLGFNLDGISLHTDIDFDLLRDYPPFQELLQPKG